MTTIRRILRGETHQKVTGIHRNRRKGGRPRSVIDFSERVAKLVNNRPQKSASLDPAARPSPRQHPTQLVREQKVRLT